MAEAETEKPISERAATVPDNSIISHVIVKDETLCTVAVGMLDSTKGQIFEAPIDIRSSLKETVVQFVKIVSEELGTEEHLAGNGNNTEAEDNKIIMDNVCIETGISNDNVTAKDDRRAVDESPSQDRLQQLSESNNKVDAQVILETSETQAEERKHGVEGETGIENLERGGEDKHTKEDSEAEIINDESTTDLKIMLVTEPQNTEITKEPIEIINKEVIDPAEDDKLESSVNAVTERTETRKLQGDEAEQEKIAETEKYNNERRDTIGSVSEVESRENGITQEPLEILEKDDIEPAKDEQEKSKPVSSLDAAPVDKEEKKLERVDEDQHVQIKAETGICDDERNNEVGNVSMAEPSETENTENIHEKMAKDDLEPVIDKLEHSKLQSSLDADPQEPEEEMLDKVTEDENVKTEDEIGNSDDERSDKFEGISTAEPSDKENRQGIPEVTAKEDNEEAEYELERIKPESPPDAAPEEPKSSMLPHDGLESCGLSKDHEKEATSKEESAVNVEEMFPENEKKYEPTEKAEFKLLPVYRDTITEFGIENMIQDGIVTTDKTNEKNPDEEAGRMPVAQECTLETIGGEMHEITANEEMIHGTENTIEQTAKETEPETIEKVSETLPEDRSNNNAADDGASLEKEIDTTCMPMVLKEQNADNQINAEETGEQSSDRADGGDINERETQTDLELTGKDAEETENAEDSSPKIKQTDEEAPGMGLSMVQKDKGEFPDGNGLIQERDYPEVGDDSVTLKELSSETGSNAQEERDDLEEKLNLDDTLECEEPEIGEHNNFIEVGDEKNHMEKQENSNKMDEFKPVCEGATANSPNPSYEPDDKEEKVRDEENQNEEVAEKHEEAFNSSCEDQAHEIENSRASEKEETSQDLELVPELVCESRSKEANTEVEDTQTENPDLDENNSMTMKLKDLNAKTQEAKEESKEPDNSDVLKEAKEESKEPDNSDVLKEIIQEESGKHEGTIESACEGLDQNSNNMSLSMDDFKNDIETANEGNRSLNEPDMEKGNSYEDEMHDDDTNSSSRELNQNINEVKYLINQGTEADFESTSQSVSQEHCHDIMVDSETTGNDIDQEFNSMDRLIDSLRSPNDPKDDDREVTDPEEAKKQISTATNGNEDSGTELVENDGDEKTEEKGSIEGEVTKGLSFHKEQMVTEKLDNNSELEHEESSDATEECAADETLKAVLQRGKSDDNIEEHSEVAPGRITAAEESIHSQDGENPSAKHEECFAEKSGTSLTLNEAVTGTDMEDLISRPDGADTERKHDVMIKKPEETSNSACEEETQETTTAGIVVEPDSLETELFQKLELVPDSEPEDKIKEIISQNDSSKIENVAYDCILKNMICETAAPSDEKENTENEANLDNDCSNSHESGEEKTHSEVCQEKGGSSSIVEPDSQETELFQKLELVPDSEPEVKIKEIISQNDSSKIENVAYDCLLKNMICETAAPSDEKENTENEATPDNDCSNSHESVEEKTHGEVCQEKGGGSSYSHEEQITQATDTSKKVEVDVSKEEKALQFKLIPESLHGARCQEETDESYDIKTDNLTDEDDTKRMISGVSDLKDHVESTNENAQTNSNTEEVDSPDSHTTIPPILPEKISEHEDASQTEREEQIYQAIEYKGNIEVRNHEEKAASEDPKSIIESEAKDANLGDITISEPISIDDTVHIHTLNKATLEIFDAPETTKIEHKNVLEKEIADVSDTLQPVVEGFYDGEGEKNENSPHLINTGDRNEDMVEEKKEIPDINSEVVPESENQDADGERESDHADKDKEAKCSVSAEIASDAPKGSNLEETVVGHGYILETDNKLENMLIGKDEVPKKEGTAENIVEILTVVNSAEVTSENQIEGKDVADVSANSELTACEEKQRLEEEIPEAASRDQHKESHNEDIDTKTETTIEENYQPLVETGTAESQTSEHAYQVAKADAHECQDYEENVECKEASLDKNMQDASRVHPEAKVLSILDNSIIEERDISKGEDKEEQGIPTSLQTDELEDKSQENEIEAQQNESSDAREKSENESFKEKKTTENDSEKEKLDVPEPYPMAVLRDLETRIEMEDTFQSETKKQNTASDNEGNINHGDMKLLESGNGLEHGNESSESTTITEESTLTEEAKDADDGMSKSKDTAIVSDNSLPDISASNGETGEVENAHISAADSPLAEQIESNSLSKGVDLDELAEQNTVEHSEKDYASTINKQDREELSGKRTGENDKIPEEDATDDQEASASSLLAQDVEGGELKKADELVHEEQYETTELEENNEEIPKKEEDFNTCLTESSKIGLNESTTAEVESLPHHMTEETEAPPGDTDEKGKDAELLTKTDIETMDDNLHVNEDSPEKNTQDASPVAHEENALGMSEHNTVEVGVISNDENKEEQDVQISLQKEELEDKQQEIEHELHPEQKAEEAIDAIHNNDNKSFQEKDTAEDDSVKARLEGPDPETSPNVIPKDLDATIENEDIHQSEKAQYTENKHEDHFPKDGDIQLEHGSQSYKSTHAKEASNPSEEAFVEDVVRLDAQKGGNCEIVGDTNDLVEKSKDTEDEEEEPFLQMKSVEPETHEKAEQSNSSAAPNEEIADIGPLNIQLQKDTNELCQFEQCSNTSFEGQVITDRIMNIRKDNASEENVVGSSHEEIWEDENLTKENIETDTNLAPNDQVKESGGGESKNKQTTMSDDTSSDIPASNEETRQVENVHENARELSYAEQTGSTSLSEGVNLDTLTGQNTMEHLQRDYASMIDKEDHEEQSEKCENENISENDGGNDGLLAQEAEGGEQKAGDLVSEERQEMLDQEKNKGEEIPKKEEDYKKVVQEVKVTSDTIDEKADDAELQSPVDTETVGDNSHVSEASVDDDIHDASEVAPEVEVLNMPEDKSIEVSALSDNKNKEVQDVKTSLQNEELEDKPQETENEIQTEQKSDESRDANENIENESFKEKDATENDPGKAKLEELEQEKSSDVILEDLKTIGNEDTHESETKNQQEENKNEEDFPKDGDMKLVDSTIESVSNSQSDKPTHINEGSSAEKETLNMKGLIDDVATIDQHNEESEGKIDGDVCVTHDLVEKNKDVVEEEPLLEKKSVEGETHETAGRSDNSAAQDKERAETLTMSNIELPKDTEELMQLEECSNTSVEGQEMAVRIENIEKNIVSEEDAGGCSHDQIQEEGTRAKQCIGSDTESVPNDEVKEHNHQPSNESLVITNQPKGLDTSSTPASIAEETKQELCENFSKISDYWPGRHNDEVSLDSGTDTENLKEMKSYAERPNEAEKFSCNSANSTSIHEIGVKNENAYVTEASRLDVTNQEGREECKEASDFMLKDVGRKFDSSIEVAEDKENAYEESARQEQRVNQTEVVTGTEELTDEASHEVEFDNLQEEKQQMGVGELPVSHFLMKYVLQEGDTHKEALVEQYKDEKYEGDERNDVKLPKEEEAFGPQSAEGEMDHDKLQDSYELLQAEGSIDTKENPSITVAKDDASPQSPFEQSPFDDLTSRPKETEEGKEQIPILSSDSRELISTKQTISEVTAENEKPCMEPDTAQDEKNHATAIDETITEKEEQKDNGVLDKDACASHFDNAVEENISQKEAGIENKERLSDAGQVESGGQSTMDEYHHGEMLETKLEVITAECGEEKEDVRNQTKMLKNDSKDKPELSESQKDSQSDLAVGSDVHTLQIGDKVLEDANSANINEKQVMETMEAKADENKNVEEKHETEKEEQYKLEKSSCIATTAEMKDLELKSIPRCDRSSKSSESSPTTDDHKFAETSELQSDGSEEQMKLPRSQEEKQSDVANESIIQPPEMAAEKLVKDRSFDINVDKMKTMGTDTNIEEDKTDDEKEEEEEHIAATNEGGRDAEPKKTPKKSLGSKVKHTIAKVKKAITGKSSHSKALSAK